MPRAVAAVLLSIRGEAEFEIDPCRAYLDCRLFFAAYRTYRACGAEFSAFRAFGTAVAVLISHLGLEEVPEVCRGAQHAVRAVAHAQLAGRTPVVEVPYAQRSGRDQPFAARGSLLVCHRRQSAVEALVLRAQRECRSGDGSRSQERPPGTVCRQVLC